MNTYESIPPLVKNALVASVDKENTYTAIGKIALTWKVEDDTISAQATNGKILVSYNGPLGLKPMLMTPDGARTEFGKYPWIPASLWDEHTHGTLSGETPWNDSRLVILAAMKTGMEQAATATEAYINERKAARAERAAEVEKYRKDLAATKAAVKARIAALKAEFPKAKDLAAAKRTDFDLTLITRTLEKLTENPVLPLGPLGDIPTIHTLVMGGMWPKNMGWNANYIKIAHLLLTADKEGRAYFNKNRALICDCPTLKTKVLIMPVMLPEHGLGR